MKKFEVDFQKRLQQQAQARRKNLGLPESDPKYKKYMREKPHRHIQNLGYGKIIHVSRPQFTEYEYKIMDDREYLLSCFKNEGWRPLYG